jgi:hypothetical protein
VRRWQSKWRYMRSERARISQALPLADWRRYHLQAGLLYPLVLFLFMLQANENSRVSPVQADCTRISRSVQILLVKQLG